MEPQMVYHESSETKYNVWKAAPFNWIPISVVLRNATSFESDKIDSYRCFKYVLSNGYVFQFLC